MEANKILSADLLDILFEGRNKEYGAYDLRKTYQQRLKRSLLIMFSFLLLVMGANFFLSFVNPHSDVLIVDKDILLAKVASPPPPAEKIIAPPPKPPAPPSAPEKFKMKMFTTPVIEKDPPEDAKPPEMKDLDNQKIGTANITEGKEDDNIVGPVGEGKAKGVIDMPKTDDNDGKPFIKVEKESEYPGGARAWTKFLERNLFNNLPQEAVDEGIEGTVMLRFVVDVDGAISDITVVSGPKEYQDAAVKAIRKSGKWTPAIQNGRQVKSYKMQAITVKLLQ